MYAGAVVCSPKCFHRHFWNEIVRTKEQHIFINGECYTDGGDEITFLNLMGFGGRKFYIQFHSGEILETNNLWYRGTVPDEYKEKLKDNAIFCSEFLAKKGDVYTK